MDNFGKDKYIRKVLIDGGLKLVKIFDDISLLQFSSNRDSVVLATVSRLEENLVRDLLAIDNSTDIFSEGIDKNILCLTRNEKKRKQKYFLNIIENKINFLNCCGDFGISLSIKENETFISSYIYLPIRNQFFFVKKRVGFFLLHPTDGSYLKKFKLSLSRNVPTKLIIKFCCNNFLEEECINCQKKIIKGSSFISIFGEFSLLDVVFVIAGYYDLVVCNKEKVEKSLLSLFITETGLNLYQENTLIYVSNSNVFSKILK